MLRWRVSHGEDRSQIALFVTSLLINISAVATGLTRLVWNSIIRVQLNLSVPISSARLPQYSGRTPVRIPAAVNAIGLR